MTDPNTIARRIAEILNANDMGGKVWDGGRLRVYVTRDLSRRSQSMGYIEIDEETGERSYSGMERRRAGVRDIVEGELAAVAR